MGHVTLQIFAIDNVQERLDLAKEFGATPANGKDRNEVLQAISKGTEGRGVDCALEAVGAQPTIKLAFDLIRMGGKICSPHKPYPCSRVHCCASLLASFPNTSLACILHVPVSLVHFYDCALSSCVVCVYAGTQ